MNFVVHLPPSNAPELDVLLAVETNPNSDSSPKNAIEAENRLSGTPQSIWDVGSGDSTIQGFTTDISYNQGETALFKIDTSADSYLLDIYRLGYYAGDGARYIETVIPSATLPQKQPNCITDSSTALVDCGNWEVSATWVIPSTSTSGIYFARAARTDTGGASHIMFVVRDDSSTSDILFKTSDTTWQAYNDYGGANFYFGGPGTQTGAYKVSYNRPFRTRNIGVYSWVFNAEYPMIRFLEANGYDVAYFTSLDVGRSGSQILRHKTMLAVGHDEYWSGEERTNVEAARAAGVHLGFFTGNGIFWKTRWEDSVDGSNTAYRTLVCYKETHANDVIDPQNPPTWTGTWRDPRFSPPADGGRPENGLQSTIFMVNGPNPDAMEVQVPQADGQMRFWRNTSVATQAPGASYSTKAKLLGYEWDTDADNGFRPAGTFHLSTATYTFGPGGPYLVDYGSTFGAGTATHHASMYRYVNGSTSALVFGSGTTQWAWALDGTHDGGSTTPDINLQQATVNLLADMGAQPATLQGGLITATVSSDSTPPTSSITSPAAGSTVQARTVVLIAGKAVDAGGGTVGGVEVSVDGGVTWHPAIGRGSWTYSWSPPTIGTATVRSRAVDDSGNLETPSAGITFKITQSPSIGISIWGTRATPGTVVFDDPETPKATQARTANMGTTSGSIWGTGATPGTVVVNDPGAVELGVKFTADIGGFISAIRFYKSSANTGTHQANLWTSDGTLLGTGTFMNETPSGWQEYNFPSPIAISAGTTYVASYFAPNGYYSADTNYFASSYDNPPLHALATATSANGVYTYSSVSTFPSSTYLASNYWVDVVLTDSGTAMVSHSVEH